MSMTKKDFQAIADIMSEALAQAHYTDRYEAYAELEDVSRKLADFCTTQNPRFNRALFLTACGVED